MDHETAVRIDAAARYYLRELREPESEAFEDHVAECSACTEDLRCLTIFAANAKAILHAEKPAVSAVERGTGSFAWLRFRWMPALVLSAAANVLLVVGLGYEVNSLARLNRPRTLPVIVAARAEKGSTSVAVRKNETSVLVLFDLPQQHADAYDYELSRGQDMVRTGTVRAPAGSEDTLYLDFPTTGLSRGQYRLRLLSTSQKSEELGRVVFEVK